MTPKIVSFTERGYGDKQITSEDRHPTEQTITIWRQADTGKTVEEICRGNNLSDPPFYRWRKKVWQLGVTYTCALQDG